MVRLKVLQVRCKHVIDCCFNSKMVRLKEDNQTLVINAHSGFNSKMVRLKGYEVPFTYRED